MERMLPLLLVLFIVVPIAELWVIVQVGQAIGIGWTLLLLLVAAVLGSVLARAQGRIAWRRFSEAVSAGRAPAREVVDGALILLGGTLLLTPGFLSDVLGIAFLLPPTRALVRRLLVRRLARRMVISMTAAGAARRAPREHDVEGTAIDVDAPTLPRS